MKRKLFWLCVIALAIGLALLAGSLLLRETQGVVVDWRAVLKRQLPIFKTQYRVVQIWYSDSQSLEDALSGVHDLNIDVWSVGKTSLIGAATAPNIRRLRKSGLRVEILYRSLEEYHSAIDELQETP
jgi:hypothetical protein